MNTQEYSVCLRRYPSESFAKPLHDGLLKSGKQVKDVIEKAVVDSANAYPHMEFSISKIGTGKTGHLHWYLPTVRLLKDDPNRDYPLWLVLNSTEFPGNPEYGYEKLCNALNRIGIRDLD